MNREPFVYEAPLGGDMYVQEGGWAAVGLEAYTGKSVKDLTGSPVDETQDVLEAAMAWFGADENDWTELPAFRLTIELMP